MQVSSLNSLNYSNKTNSTSFKGDYSKYVFSPYGTNYNEMESSTKFADELKNKSSIYPGHVKAIVRYTQTGNEELTKDFRDMILKVADKYSQEYDGCQKSVAIVDIAQNINNVKDYENTKIAIKVLNNLMNQGADTKMLYSTALQYRKN